jgi:hypothetical protein
MYRENLNFCFVTTYLPFVHNCFFYQLWLCCFNNYRGRLCDVSLLHFIVSNSICKSVPVIFTSDITIFTSPVFILFMFKKPCNIYNYSTRLWSCSCESTQLWMLYMYKKHSKLLTELSNLLFIIHSFYCCECFVETCKKSVGSEYVKLSCKCTYFLISHATKNEICILYIFILLCYVTELLA